MIGTILNGRYRIDAKIGSGGMATVYEAYDQTLERPVAIKVLNHEISAEESALERFRREARTAAQISHPNVVMVIDAGEDRGRPYIVFEHVEGETLKERIRRDGPLRVTEAIAYAIEIGRALEAAHERQLVHRDVKPQNVLLDPEGHAKVTDFGIARSLDIALRPLTAAGRVMGTTDYVSPEQALGHDVTGQSDVYSLGIVLYEMLTGDVPFSGDTSITVAMKHVREGLPDLQRRRPEVSAALAAVVEKATAKDVASRYGSVGELVRELEQVLTYEAARSGTSEEEATAVLSALPGERRWPGGRKRALRVAGLALAVVALAVAAGIAIESTRDEGGDGGARPGLSAIRLGDRDASDYDPPPGDGGENAEAAVNVLDGDAATVWETEGYDSPELGNIKDGVGLYLDAGRPVVASAVRISTPQPGWAMDLYVSNEVPGSVADWLRVGGGEMEGRRRTFGLDTGDQRFRHFLVWITKLVERPTGRYGAGISELRLLG
jgi:tRNA A-37 threonylcarbamoyl transferase component Bud32